MSNHDLESEQEPADPGVIVQASESADRFAEASRAFQSTINEIARTPSHAKDAQDLTGKLIGGRYLVQSTLGAGGMGAVYKVFDQLDQVDRALKVAHASLYAKEEGQLRFRQEFMAMASLLHTNLPVVLDYGFGEDRAPFLVMELVDGDPMRVDKPMEITRFYSLFVQYLRALGFIHDRGFLHRDIKPTNTLITSTDESGKTGAEKLVLLDFGLMERIGTNATKHVAGTPAYIAPEVIKGRALDPRVDLYSLGILGFELLTGQRPFHHHDTRELLAMHESAVRPHANMFNAAVPAALDQLILAMMSADPSNRPSSAEDVLRELSKLTNHVQSSDLESRKAYLRLADFVGREAELQTLRHRLGHAERDNAGCCLVSGRTGCGKSRLLNEIQLDALLRGFTAAGVEVREDYRAPYQSLSILLRCLVPLATEVNCLPTQSAALKRLLPNMEDADLEQPSTATPQAERGLLIEETIVWLRELARHRPLLLLADDLQWCDESSLLVMRAVSRHLRSSKILFVGSFRADEIVIGSDLDQWQHFSEVTIVNVPGFDDEQMMRFFDALLGRHSLGVEFIHRAASVTDGSPFFTIELLRDLIDRDALVRQNGVWNLAQESPDLPESVSRLISQRIGRVSKLSQEVALQIAVAGGHLPISTVLRLFDSDDDRILDGIETLVQNRLAEQSHDVVTLCHDSVRETIYESADAGQRRTFHQRLGEFLEQSLPQDSAERASVLGHHFSRGTAPVKGLQFLEQAGKSAYEREEHGVARDLLVEADRLLQELPDCDQRDQRLYDVRMMLTQVCVSNDYVLGAEVGDWVCDFAIKRSLPSLPRLRRILPDPLSFLFIAVVQLPLRVLRRGRKAREQFESDVLDIFRATGYLCNSLASTSKLTASRVRAERLKAFATSRSSLALGIMEIAQTIGKYHQDGAGFVDDFRHAKHIFETSKQARAMDAYSMNLMIGVCYYAEAISAAWEQHPSFLEHFANSETHATKTNNHFIHHLNHQAKIENAVYSGDVQTAEASEVDFYKSVEHLGGKSRQRQWLVDFAMGLSDVNCGRLERAARRKNSLLRGGPGYFTEGYGSLIGARLNLQWVRLDDALQEAQLALRWARDPEVAAKLFEFRVQSTLADIYLQQLRRSEANAAIKTLHSYAHDSYHTTDYFAIETNRRQAELFALSDPPAGLAVARTNLCAAAESASRLQYAEANATVARLMTACAQQGANHHWEQAARVYDELGNQHRAGQARAEQES